MGLVWRSDGNRDAWLEERNSCNGVKYTSLGQVMILGNSSFFSFWPLAMASRKDGWSEPRLTKTWVTPAYSCQRTSRVPSESIGVSKYLPECLEESERCRVNPSSYMLVFWEVYSHRRGTNVPQLWASYILTTARTQGYLDQTQETRMSEKRRRMNEQQKQETQGGLITMRRLGRKSDGESCEAGHSREGNWRAMMDWEA